MRMDLKKLAQDTVKKENPHRKIIYTYSKGTAKASCSCSWQSRIFTSPTGLAALEKAIEEHKKKPSV